MARFACLAPLIALAWIPIAAFTPSTQDGGEDDWTREFFVDKSDLTHTGRNPYFILEPGYQLVLEGKTVRLLITVLDETRMVDGVETRIVEEHESKAGKVIEVSRNFFAISKRTNSVFYFGEEVDIYKDGQLTGHAGAWLSGENGAKFGLMMPGEILLEGKHYQEFAPGEAMDRARIVSISETLETPAGDFKDVLKVEETTPLEADELEYKYYARGIGLLQDESLTLIEYGKLGRERK
jgi:hypothetical protein